jgi:hypothetical protein
VTTTDGDQTKPKPFVELAIAAAAPALAVMTGLIYGVLVLAHSEFHSELGVRPSDAGVEYGPGLGGAAGIVALIGGAAALLTGGVTGIWWVVSKIRSNTKKPTARHVLLGGAAIAIALGVVISVLLVWGANNRADTVKQGRPLEPLRIAGIELLGIRADLADVEVVRLAQAANPSAKTPVASAPAVSSEGVQIIAGLRSRGRGDKPLLYLGRSAVAVVVYDSENQRVLQLPTAMTVVQTHNCETQRRDARCNEILLAGAPPATTTSTSASFAFTTDEPGATFECSLDSVMFAPCSSPKDYRNLAVDEHEFRVRARDKAGNVDASPPTHASTIAGDTTAPGTTLSVPAE